MQRPTVFISSTIYDFHDLRSSLKFYLEEQGFTVLASEFNDFKKPLDTHSYEACLEAVGLADYFILLVGSRVGGWYDEPNRISITQKEYRVAYELHKAGKLKILAFVRSEVWQAKEARRELHNHLKATGAKERIGKRGILSFIGRRKSKLDEETKKAIENHESKFMDDPKFICEFISEVGRNAETKRAVSGHGVAPSGNWIHQFSTFRDVVDALNGQLFSSIPLEDMTMRTLLRQELRQFVSQCMVKFSPGVSYSARPTIDAFHRSHPITLDSCLEPLTQVTVAQWDRISMLALAMFGRQFRPVVLPQALTRSTFLEFNLESNTFCRTPAYDALLLLQEEIANFNAANTPSKRKVISDNTKGKRATNAPTIEVDTMELIDLLGLFDRWANILELSVALSEHLDGRPFPKLDLRPQTPIKGMQEALDEENPSEAEITIFLDKYRK
ncbi:DUF4062 domain-containing protein [Pandoraea bronchicola]|uniref:DUF4062 domain-containing protein n=1 Tax=Pandoraea bronchicola TaxID=2508287 RepID=A0A5E5BRH4_9BURK|nr:DUF4062 domain-containing protein [Pandoraea bronchicola]VVE88399.1 hypothetical protein PBR20603_02354 [Pandoraea bronchicola]